MLKAPSCSEWLNCIPLYFFINEENPFFECNRGILEDGRPVSDKAKFLDQESCISAFEKIPYLRALKLSGQSPTSVTDNNVTDRNNHSNYCSSNINNHLRES